MSSPSASKKQAISPEITCLHLVMRSNADLLDQCLACVGENDSVVLMDAGVGLVGRPDFAAWLPGRGSVYCLQADLLARGLGELSISPGLETISDQGLIQLVCQHDHCLSWK
jgi:sulfur relay protein TusB/DsrH